MSYLFSCFVLFSLGIPLITSLEEETVRDYETCSTGDFIIISTIDGIITALDIKTGKKCWTVLLDAEKFLSSTLSELEVYENGQRVWLVPSLDGSIFKYDNYKLYPLPVDVDSLISHSAYLDASTTIIGGKVKTIFGINRLNGEIIYVCNINECKSLKIPFPENILLVEESVQLIKAVDPSTAQNKWHFRVVELNLRLTSRGPSENSSEFYKSIEKNALIPQNFKEYINLRSYKVSLLNGFAGMLDKSSKYFAWLFKTSCAIHDAWFITDDVVQMLDPFEKDSGFFSVEMDDGKYSALLFLDILDNIVKRTITYSEGTYQDQMFIKISKKYHHRNIKRNSLSMPVFHYSNSFHVCPKTDYEVASKNHSQYAKEIVPANLYINASEYGSYFYINDSIAENRTHCIINSSYIVQYHKNLDVLDVSYWFGLYITVVFVFLIIPVFIGVFWTINDKKQLVNKSTSSLELTLSKCQEVTEVSQEFRSRFFQDFELLTILGKGGFGVVMDVKNKIDDCRYAVKRIRIHDKFNSSQYEKLLREVKALAKLEHCGIVRYFNAWIEHPPVGWQEAKDAQLNICDISESDVSSSFSSEVNYKQSLTNKISANVLDKLKHNPLLAFNDPFHFNAESVPNNPEFSDNSASDDSENSTSSGLIKWQRSSHSNHQEQNYSKNLSFQTLKASRNVGAKSKMIVLEKSSDENKSTSSSKRFYVNKPSAQNKEINLFLQSYEETLERHIDCHNMLQELNQFLIKTLNFSKFDSFCTYFFHDMAVFDVPLMERPDWKKVMHMSSKKEMEDFQTWLICMLCMIRSKVDFICDVEIQNFCTLLWDVTKRLNASYDKNGCLSNSDLEQPECSVHFSHSSDNHDVTESSKIAVKSKEVSFQESEESAVQVVPGYLYIQMQLCQKESLRDWLNRNSADRDYKKVMEIFIEIVDAVHYVHNCGLMHRDLKPSNIYFSLEGAIKIGDFGLATSSEIHDEKNEKMKKISVVHTTDIGTEFYMSPEQTKVTENQTFYKVKKLKEDYDCKTDIFSLGIILFELLVPFKTYSERYKVLSKVRLQKFPDDFVNHYQKESQLVQQMLHKDPKKRPSTDDIKRHPLLLQFLVK